MQERLGKQAEIKDTLGGIRSRIRRRSTLESIPAAIVAVLGAGLGVFLLEMSGNGLPPVIAWFLVAAAGVLAATAYVRTRMEGFDDDADVARLIERYDSGYRNDVRAALQFSREGETGDQTRDSLRRRLLQRVGDRLSEDEQLQDEVVPRGRMTAFAAAGLSVVMLAGVFALSAPKQASLSWQAMLGSEAVAETSEGTNAVSRPVVSTLSVVVDPPGYSGRETRRIPSSTGDIEALAGSELKLSGRALEDVQKVTLVLDRGDEVQRREMSLTDTRAFQGQLLAERSGNYHFEVVTTDGTSIRDPIERRLSVLPDEAPTIQVRQPVENLEVEPGDIVDFEYVVSDDFGISEVNFEWHFAGDEEDVRELPLLGELDTTRKVDTAAFDTAPMMLQPGDELVVTIEAFDNNSLTGPSRGVSRPISLSVASPDELNEEILALKEQLLEDLLGQLGAMLSHSMNTYRWDEEAEELVATPMEMRADERASLVADAAETNRQWTPILDKLRTLSELMTKDDLTPPREATLIEGGYNALYERERDMKEAYASLETDVDSERIDKAPFHTIATQHAGFVDDTERVTLVLEELIATQKADAVSRALEELSATRDRLRELLEQYKETEDPYLRQQIEREMERLGQRMQELLARLSDQVDRMPWEHVNREAMEKSEAQQNVSDMGTSMEQMQQMLNEGNIEGALQALEQMSQSLDMMMQELGNPLASGDPSTLSEFDQQMGEIMDEIGDLEAKEQELERETSELEEEWRKQRQEEIKEEIEERLSEARERIQEVREEMSRLDREELMSRSEEQLNESEDALRRLSERLESEDIAGAEEAAMRAVSELNDANRSLEFMQRYMQGDGDGQRELQRASETTESGREAASEVAESMRELMEMAQPSPGEQGRQQMQELAERQQQISEQMGELEGQLQQMGQRFPMMNGQFGEQIEQIGEGMQESESGLRGVRMRPAKDGQQQALQGLRSLRQQMQQQMAKRRQQQQQQQGQRGRDVSQEQVEIPEEAQDGSDYREDVVEAMREGSLEAYDEEIRKYYESLVE